MTIIFYNVTDDPRVLEKTLGSSLYSTSFNLLKACNVKNPELILAYHPSIISANYFKIPEWGRFYFMGEPVVAPGGRCLVTGKEDVLMSNKDEILELNSYCSRCESRFERYAIDNCVPSLMTTIVTNLQFSEHYFNAMDTQGTGLCRQYLLTVKGGALNAT